MYLRTKRKKHMFFIGNLMKNGYGYAVTYITKNMKNYSGLDYLEANDSKIEEK